MRKRTGSIMAAVAVVGAALVAIAVTGTTSTAAPMVLNVSASSVAVGSSITVSSPGCDGSESGGARRSEIVLITGTGSSARLAALGTSTTENNQALSVPGWVDPGLPAVVAGRCLEPTVGADGVTTLTPTFTYADVPVDITPGPPGPPAPTISLDRSTAAAGQIITVSVSGCAPNSLIQAVLLDGSDLSGRGPQQFIATGTTDNFSPSPSGSADIELVLNVPPPPVAVPATGSVAGTTRATRATGDLADGGPLPEGSYIATVACAGPGGPVFFAEPEPVQVAGTNPTDSLRLEPSTDGASAAASGEGCTGGRTVTVTTNFTTFAAGPSAAGPSVGPSAPIVTASTVTPDPDGSWSQALDLPSAEGFSGFVSADCGLPTADGFRYVGRSVGGDTAPGPPVVPGPPTPPPAPPAPNPPSTPSVPSAPGAPALPGQGNYTG